MKTVPTQFCVSNFCPKETGFAHLEGLEVVDVFETSKPANEQIFDQLGQLIGKMTLVKYFCIILLYFEHVLQVFGSCIGSFESFFNHC